MATATIFAEIFIVIGVLIIILLFSPRLAMTFQVIQKEQIQNVKNQIFENTARLRIVSDTCSLYNSSIIFVRNTGKTEIPLDEISIFYNGQSTSILSQFIINESVFQEVNYSNSTLLPGQTILFALNQKILEGNVKLVGPQRISETKNINLSLTECYRSYGSCSIATASSWAHSSTLANSDTVISTTLIASNGISGYTFYFANGTNNFVNDSYVSLGITQPIYYFSIVKRLNSTCNSLIRFYIQINDSCGFLRNSSIGYFYTTC